MSFYIDHLRGCSDRIFGLLGAREHICKKVGHEQQLIRALKKVRAVFFERIELEQGVKLHKLDARAGIELLARDRFEHLVYEPRGACVAVMNGIFKQAAELVEEPEINTPGVNADAVETACELCFRQPLLYFKEQPQNIPVERPADAHGVI